MADPTTAFAARLLELLRVPHVWSEEGVVRVYPHPGLETLIGEAPFLDLALSEESLRLSPAAVSCLPGSFALDVLLNTARELPAAFHSRLSGESLPADVPPGLPGFANARVSVVETLREERGALYALFRAGFHSDELVERLLAVALDQEGTPRPGWPARLEPREREVAPGPVALPGGVLDALGAEAERAAREMAQELLPGVEARKGAEMARLEAYLRALRDELQAAVPAGPARRAARIQAEARQALDALRLALPGEGPWEREAVLSAVWQTPRFGPKQPPGGSLRPDSPLRELPPALQWKTIERIGGLPQCFTLADVEGAVDGEAHRRLERLERGLGEGAGELDLLGERERALAEEHRARVADIESKFSLRVLLRPVLLEWLTYPALAARFRVEGAAEAEFSSMWHALSGAWDLPPCASCGGLLEAGWLCERGHLACAACASVCGECRRARCAGCAFDRCAVCGETACDGCGLRCARCGEWNCRRHARPCETCRETACARCGGACNRCAVPLCPDHHATCALCGGTACAEHHVACHLCGQVACAEHGDRCPCCARPYCGSDASACSLCGRPHCRNCAGERGRCDTCRSLQEVGPDTVAALRSRLQAVVPLQRPGRFRRWWLARNSRYTVVVARRWPWSYLFVLGEATGELVHSRRFWSWTGV